MLSYVCNLEINVRSLSLCFHSQIDVSCAMVDCLAHLSVSTSHSFSIENLVQNRDDKCDRLHHCRQAMCHDCKTPTRRIQCHSIAVDIILLYCFCACSCLCPCLCRGSSCSTHPHCVSVPEVIGEASTSLDRRSCHHWPLPTLLP